MFKVGPHQVVIIARFYYAAFTTSSTEGGAGTARWTKSKGPVDCDLTAVLLTKQRKKKKAGIDKNLPWRSRPVSQSCCRRFSRNRTLQFKPSSTT
ncbi:unnamed protein product [Linum trigynum]|uniref:Uncharacterized protein n=1 Tax=Linum trigynum TaxID=586398 RepID=A0AAV2FRW3_9ROSI